MNDFHDSGAYEEFEEFADFGEFGEFGERGEFEEFDFEAFEWDQTAMALIGYALSEDTDASAALLGPLSAGDLREIAERLADILARTLLEEAEVAGVDRDEVVASWQSCVLQHAAQRRPY